MIEGGWEYIRAAYGITWGVLVCYGLILWWSHRRLCRREGEGVVPLPLTPSHQGRGPPHPPEADVAEGEGGVRGAR